jgi:hypothetical protein
MSAREVEYLRNRLNWAEKRVKFAWAKYYNQVHQQLQDAHAHYTVVVRTSDDVSIPEHIKKELKDMASSLKKQWECPICMGFIEEDNLEITNCGHYYCKPCLAQWIQSEKDRHADKWKCGMCNRKHKFPEAGEPEDG